MSFKEKVAQKYNAVKSHLIEHKKVYITGGICFIAGVASYAIISDDATQPQRRIPIRNYNGGGNAQVSIEAESITDSPIHVEQTTNDINNFGGHSTKIVKCVETGEIFGSVNDAARSVGVAQSKMSLHLNGRKDHVYGYTYEIIGLGTTS